MKSEKNKVTLGYGVLREGVKIKGRVNLSAIYGTKRNNSMICVTKYCTWSTIEMIIK